MEAFAEEKVETRLHIHPHHSIGHLHIQTIVAALKSEAWNDWYGQMESVDNIINILQEEVDSEGYDRPAMGRGEDSIVIMGKCYDRDRSIKIIAIVLLLLVVIFMVIFVAVEMHGMNPDNYQYGYCNKA